MRRGSAEPAVRPHARTPGPVLTALGELVRAGSRVERLCWLLALTMVVSGLFHLGAQALGDRPWSDPASWRKPATFGLSFGSTLATLIWVGSYLPLSARARDAVLGTFAAACVVEVSVISVQAWRGLPSHFTPAAAPVPALNGALGAAAAAGAVAILLTAIVLVLAAFRRAPAVAASMRLAVRVGLLSYLVALGVGAVMLTAGMVLARSGDIDGAFAFTGGLKAGHAATMHGVLILPALARVAALGSGGESSRVRLVAVAAAGYVLFAGTVVVECLAGLDPLDARETQLGAALAVGGATLLLAAGAAAAVRVARRPVRAAGRR